MNNKLVDKRRILALILLLVVILLVYLSFLYQRMIVDGEEYYSRNSAISKEKRAVTAARGDILDRYGRELVTNKECYDLKIDNSKLFATEDPNSAILEMVAMVNEFGDEYVDDLPITKAPPFEYTEMTDIQRTMLNAYFKDKGSALPDNPTAVELLSYMRTRYGISNSYSAEDMRIIAGVRYSINVRYAVPTDSYVFVKDASMQLINSIMEQKIGGIIVERSYVRDFKTEYAAHLLGYVGLMTQEEFEKYSLRDYANNAMVGKDGVELAFEEYLHGQDGEVEETRNAAGTIMSTVYLKEPEPGNHVYLTIDKVLQEAVERILSNGVNILTSERLNYKSEQEALGLWEFEDGYWEITGAACAVVNVKTGEPLALASWPTYDPSRVIEDFAQLLEAPNQPLFNRALLGAYAPGSAFKPCTAITALTEGVINTEEMIKCEGVFTKYAADGYAPECWIWSATKDHLTHGELDVTHALLHSCNYFFYTVGETAGVDNMERYAHNFGLGVSTGIELIETTAHMSNEDDHIDYAGQPWRIGDTMQAAIGQSDSIFTPLQLAEYCATVANKGNRHSASILKSVRSYDYATQVYDREAEVLSRVVTGDFNWEAVQNGMRLVANDLANNGNVAKYFVDQPTSQRTAAKTGTAQKGEHIVNDAIFICYSPFNDPEVAIAIVVERGKAGANCAFMARQILDVYYNIKSYSDSSEAEMALLR